MTQLCKRAVVLSSVLILVRHEEGLEICFTHIQIRLFFEDLLKVILDGASDLFSLGDFVGYRVLGAIITGEDGVTFQEHYIRVSSFAVLHVKKSLRWFFVIKKSVSFIIY